ncbi:MAG: family oxidoreductase [Alphaproteobacteria bacterium]|nr:family oxidoreductase [Alphaproteobacteria bacterium]
MPRPATLITGASAGLGAEFARLCAARGEELVLVARRRDRLEALAAELGNAHVVVADLAVPGAPRRLLAETEALGVSIETLINNAGFGQIGRIAALSVERQSEMIELNIRALVELTRLVLPAMIERGHGAILNLASTAAFQPGPNYAVYFASKAFVLSFTEALHQEMKGAGVRVSALCPGPTSTEFGQVAGVTRPIPEFLSADARSVAKAGLRGLDRNRAVVVPGLFNKLGTQSSRFVPRALMRRIVASVKA